MATNELKKRIELLETQVARIQSTLATAGVGDEKNWRRAVDKYLGDEDLLAALSEGTKLREAERKKARQGRTRTPKS